MSPLPVFVCLVIEFLNEDATKRDWSDADMWFANSTCFDHAVCGCGVVCVCFPFT